MEIDGIRVGSRAKDLSGQKFGKLAVIRLAFTRRGLWWSCRCDCGEQTVVDTPNLVSGNTRSCGCGKRDVLLKRNTTHGMTRTPEYQAWNGIITRCTNPRRPDYKNWGGRGVRMCDRWRYGENGKSGFECFLEDVGPRPGAGLTLDRIDNDGHYEPGNVRWADRLTQSRNRRNVTRPLTELQERYGD